MKCPLCGNKEVKYRSAKKKDGTDTHIYVCPECPYIAVEYYDDEDLLNLNNLIK